MSIAEKLQTIAENEQKIYDKGKQDEYDRFWDEFQQNGNRTDYYYAFCGAGWTKETLKPKYIIKPLSSTYGAQQLFRLANRLASQDEVIDYRTIKDKVDLSLVTNFTAGFYSSCINFIDVDLPNGTTLNSCFSAEWNSTFRTDIKLKITEKCTNYTNAFAYCSELINLTFKEGSVIAATISFNRSPKLTKASLLSIFAALSTTTSGLTVTVHRTSVNKAFETSEGANDGSTSQEWLSLVATRSNWTVSLSDLT